MVHTTTTIYITLVVLCLFLAFQWYKTWLFHTKNSQITKHVFRNIDAYIILIDSNFIALKTNYYAKTGEPQSPTLLKIGNLLHCKNGTDAGECGKHILCNDCPIRKAINDSFCTKMGFSKLEAQMLLYTSPQTTIECTVAITGSYMEIAAEENLLLTIQNITQQKQTEQALTDARRRAEESDRMKTLFLANTGHEFRTPLNAITGFSELLAANPTIEEKESYLAIIRENNDILLHLVNNILDLSKIEAENLDFDFSDEELNTIMYELEETFCQRLKTNKVKVQFDQKYDICHVRADRRRFMQVMSNFLSNALKFTEKGEIVFGYEIRLNELYFYVRDTGIGIPEDQRQHLFQRFAKVGSHKQGAGIGLAICKCIINSIGGQIGVESQQGEGSTFWFTVPDKQMYDPK